MATYWKSQPRKFCDFCKCWITDNKPSVEFHEKGKRHQENVQKRIDEVRKKSTENAKIKEELDDDMKKMEMAALEAFKKDLAENPELAAQYNAQIQAAKDEKEKKKQKEEEERRKKEEEKRRKEEEMKIEWYEAQSPEGYSYYWHIHTNESVWVAPEKYVSLDEQKRREEEEKRKEEERLKEEQRKEEEAKRRLEEKEAVSASNVDTEELLQMNYGPQPRQANKNVYGAWVTVNDNTQEPEPEPDPTPLPVEAIPLPGDLCDSDNKNSDSDNQKPKERSRFKEKRITSLGENTGEAVGFKKRKIASGARNIRRREED